MTGEPAGNTRLYPLIRRDLWGIIGAVALGTAAFAVTVGFEFVYDDVRIIVQRTDFHSLSNWQQILTSTWWPDALYRPVSQLSIAFDWTLSDGNPHYFHAVNVVLHAIVVVLVFFVARIHLTSLGASATALLFAIHPVHVEAVANVVGRAEVLATLFALSAVLLYRWDGLLADAANVGWRRWAASFGTLGCLVFGVASKESALAIPGLLIIADWLDGMMLGKPVTTQVRRHAVLWFGSVALSVAWLSLRSSVIGNYVGDFPSPGLFGEGFMGRVWVMAPVIIHYLRLLVFPYHLSADYSPGYVPAVASPTLWGVVGLLVLMGCIVAAVRVHRSWPIVTFALAWIGGTLLIVSNLIVPTGILLAERSMYLPSVGAVLIGGVVVQQAAGRWRRGTATAVAVVVALGMVRTITRVPVWKDDDAFYQRMVQDAPGSFRSQWVEGMMHYTRGERQRGEQLLWMALDTYPLFANVWFDLGRRLQEDGRWQEAAQAFEVAFRIDSSRVGDAASAVTNYVRAGMLDTAQVIVDRARAIDPRHPRVFLALADIAMSQSRPLEAMTLRRQANLAAPDAQGYWFLTADAAIRAEYCPEAIHSTSRLRQLDPDYSQLDALDERMRALGCEI